MSAIEPARQAGSTETKLDQQLDHEGFAVGSLIQPFSQPFEYLIINHLGAVIMENGFTCMSETDALGTDCNQFIEKCNSEIELVNHLVTNICAQTCCLHNQKL